MNYTLKTIESEKKVTSTWTAIKNFWVFLRTEQRVLALASITIIVNSGANLLSPVIIGYAIDHFIQTKQYAGLLWSGAGLGALYLIALGASYAQTRLMGGVGQRVLFNLRAGLFDKIQALPVAFFNQNKAGDLISRINNDTDKLNQFFSQTLMQFIGNIFIMIGAGIFLVYLKPNLGLAALVPALLMFVFNRLVTPWVKQKNDVALQREFE